MVDGLFSGQEENASEATKKNSYLRQRQEHYNDLVLAHTQQVLVTDS